MARFLHELPFPCVAAGALLLVALVAPIVAFSLVLALFVLAFPLVFALFVVVAVRLIIIFILVLRPVAVGVLSASTSSAALRPTAARLAAAGRAALPFGARALAQQRALRHKPSPDVDVRRRDVVGGRGQGHEQPLGEPPVLWLLELSPQENLLRVRPAQGRVAEPAGS